VIKIKSLSHEIGIKKIQRGLDCRNSEGIGKND
jgi:hypothetical protein